MLKTLVVLLLLLSRVGAESWAGKVVDITDGDTFRILKGGRETKVRLHGIDTPEQGQPFGAKAKQYASALAFGKSVRADVLDTDKYGRTVALLYLEDGRCINHELTRQGFAWWYAQYAPGDTLLARLERQAREGGLGLWEDPAPIEPWNWRKGERQRRVGDPAAPRAPLDEPNAVEPSGPSFVESSPGQQESQEIVYRTRTGAKYHRVGCRYLKSVIQTTVGAAVGMGLTPCSVCGPSGLSREGVQRVTVPDISPSSILNRCQATTKKGTQFKRGAGVGGFCWQHGR